MLAALLLAAPAARSEDSPWRRHTEAGKQAWEAREYDEAERHFAAALRAAEQYGPHDARLVEALQNLGSLHLALGNYSQAEPLHRRILRIREASLPAGHPRVAESLNNLGAVLSLQGAYAEAESLYLRALEIRKEALGPQHPEVAQSLNNLADLYRLLGAFDRAETHYRRALDILEKSLGPDDPRLVIHLNNLATLYYETEQYDRAEPLYRRALAVGGKTLGWHDPAVAASLLNLAALYRAQGRPGEAEPLRRWALAFWEKELGRDHPVYRQARAQTPAEPPPHHAHGSTPLHEAEMGAPGEPTGPPLAEVVVRPGMAAFAMDYFTSGPEKRPVFERHWTSLGAGGILDFLEATFPMCHEQAHELGQVVLARSPGVGEALRQCLTRCTSACMHGILKEALAGEGEERAEGSRRSPVAAAADIVSLCQDPEMTRIHKPGNCAHGMGHAFLMNSGYDLERALAWCASFPDAGLEYYCATGLFMEYLVTGRPAEDRLRELHFPCDVFDRFPAACYRYKVPEMVRAFGEDRERAAVECLALPPARRRGCFHGLGTAYVRAIFRQPPLLADVCRHGAADDQTMCIEGAVEKLADYNQERARVACAALEGVAARVCAAAAEGKMYRLDKPSFALYLGR